MCGYRCCFFFQAEDGIRDLTVTGVQTCALPISGRSPLGRAASRASWVLLAHNGRRCADSMQTRSPRVVNTCETPHTSCGAGSAGPRAVGGTTLATLGRAFAPPVSHPDCLRRKYEESEAARVGAGVRFRGVLERHHRCGDLFAHVP